MTRGMVVLKEVSKTVVLFNYTLKNCKWMSNRFNSTFKNHYKYEERKYNITKFIN